jgi:hypothetical protein
VEQIPLVTILRGEVQVQAGRNKLALTVYKPAYAAEVAGGGKGVRLWVVLCCLV